VAQVVSLGFAKDNFMGFTTNCWAAKLLWISIPLGDLLINQEILIWFGCAWVMICEEFVNMERNIIERLIHLG